MVGLDDLDIVLVAKSLCDVTDKIEQHIHPDAEITRPDNRYLLRGVSDLCGLIIA